MSETHSNPSAVPTSAPAPAQSNRRTKLCPRYFKFTQLGNAERLVYNHGSDIRYCPAWKSWLVWSGNQWRVDKNGAIHRKAHQTIREMGREAKKIKDKNLKSLAECHARRSETKYELESMIDIAKKLNGVSVTPDELDANPMLLNCENGVIDLRNGSLIPHSDSRKLLLTKIAPVNYHPSARCPQWLKFLDRIFDHNTTLIEYVQKIIGYSLTGDVTEKALFMFHGDGNNGKTTLLETIRRLLGDYAGMVEIDALMSKSQDSARERAMASLHGKRFVTASESDYGQHFNEALIKRLTGMGRLEGRYLYSNSFQFDPLFKLFIDANHKPIIKGTDEAIWIRMRLLPFTVTIPKDEIDKDLWRKLRAELPGILAWAVEGCLKWRKEGLTIPSAVSRASEAYREEMDIVSMFLSDCCDADAGSTERALTLYQAFTAWCRENGEGAMDQASFGRRLGKLGYTATHTRAGNCWKGLRLRSDDSADSPLEPMTFADLDLSKITIEPGEFRM
jgi:putative DNA primase/helicase